MHENELRAKVAGLIDEIDTLAAKDDITEEDRASISAKETERDAALAELKKVVEREARKAEFNAIPKQAVKPEPETRVEVTRNETTYRKGDAPGDHSFYRDYWAMIRYGDAEARERLVRNNLEARDLTRTDTTSVGEFVPPAWLLNLYQPGLRASRRVAANLCTQMALPQGTDSINIPRISTNPTVAAQTADNATVNEVDTVSATVNAPVQTFAGQNDVAIQVLEQSPLAGGFDQLIFSELMADLDRYVDTQVINGQGSSGQVQGIVEITIAGSNKVAYTDGSPTVPELFPNFGKVLSLTSTARKDQVTAFVMHPRRWYWLTSQVDSANRAYVVPTANGPTNAYGVQSDGGIAEGPVGQILGVPVYLDPNIPVLLTNGAGAAGTEDIIIAGRWSDAILMESTVRTRILPEVLSGTLTTRLQVYEFAAFTCERAGGTSFGSIYDTGMAAPSGY
jgi:HK97 family phage major capsid protein